MKKKGKKKTWIRYVLIGERFVESVNEIFQTERKKKDRWVIYNTYLIDLTNVVVFIVISLIIYIQC